MELLVPSIEQLVKEIVAVNHAWKEADKLFEPASPLAISLRDLKTRLQIRLLRTYAPEHVLLIEDLKESDEPLYGLQLLEPIEGWTDAAHIPVRVAQQSLLPEELKQFTKRVINYKESEEQW